MSFCKGAVQDSGEERKPDNEKERKPAVDSHPGRESNRKEDSHR